MGSIPTRPTIAELDLYRLVDGKLAEHWDALTPQVNQTVSGRSQIDGPAEVSDIDKTEANRALVLAFVEKVLKVFADSAHCVRSAPAA